MGLKSNVFGRFESKSIETFENGFGVDRLAPFFIEIINTDQPFTLMMFCMNVADESSKDRPEVQRTGCRWCEPASILGQGTRRLFVFREARRVFCSQRTEWRLGALLDDVSRFRFRRFHKNRNHRSQSLRVSCQFS